MWLHYITMTTPYNHDQWIHPWLQQINNVMLPTELSVMPILNHQRHEWDVIESIATRPSQHELPLF